MFLYLVQHAEAMTETEDPERPLTKKGIHDIQRVMEFAKSQNTAFSHIYHSTKLRAKQTAEILAKGLRPSGGLVETVGLAPLDEPGIWAQRLREMSENSVLVGHLPHLSRLAALLLCGRQEKQFISFRQGGVVCLHRDEQGAWMIEWILVPEL